MSDEVCPSCGADDGAFYCVEYDLDEDVYVYECTECSHVACISDDDETWK